MVKRKIKITEHNKRINLVAEDKELTKRFIDYSEGLTIKEILILKEIIYIRNYHYYIRNFIKLKRNII